MCYIMYIPYASSTTVDYVPYCTYYLLYTDTGYVVHSKTVREYKKKSATRTTREAYRFDSRFSPSAHTTFIYIKSDHLLAYVCTLDGAARCVLVLNVTLARSCQSLENVKIDIIIYKLYVIDIFSTVI